MEQNTIREWMVRWLLLAAALHLVVGAALPWLAGGALLDDYHRGIEAAFWPAGAPGGARELQAWWMALFGPTIQVMALWMAALIHLAGRMREARIWLWLVAGLLVWAPQDMLVSLRAACWAHVWTDAAALAVMLPPLLWLWRHDRAASRVVPAGGRGTPAQGAAS